MKEYANEANYHIKKDWGGGYYGNGLQYHYKVARDGKIYRTRDVEEVTWHATNANPIAVGICLDGDLTKQKPTEAQLNGLRELLDEICAWLSIPKSKVFGHKELSSYGNFTQCPGSALQYVIEYRDTGTIKLSTDKKPEKQEINIKEYEGKLVALPNGDRYIIESGKKVIVPDLPTLFAFGYYPEQETVLSSQNALDSVEIGGQLQFPNAPNRKLLEAIKRHRAGLEPWLSSK
jgi:hypothetical protein